MQTAAQTSSCEIEDRGTEMRPKLAGSFTSTETAVGKNVDKSASAPKFSDYSRVGHGFYFPGYGRFAT